MAVAYFVQSHRGVPQLLRLLTALRRGSPAAPLVLGHCPSGPDLPLPELAALDVLVFRHREQGRRGYWSLLEPYFDAVELLARHQVPYEWLVYLSGQDYPAKPLSRIEQELGSSPWDAYMTWRNLGERSPDGRRRQGVVRYGYRYRDLPPTTGARLVLGALRRLNGLQHAFHVHLTYGPRLGTRQRALPLPPGHTVRFGSQWTTLRRRCAEELARAAREEGPLVEHFRSTICPDEAFAQTWLLARGYAARNDNLRFVDLRGSRDGHPRTLRMADASELASGRYHFARKVDLDQEPELIDWLDRHLETAG